MSWSSYRYNLIHSNNLRLFRRICGHYLWSGREGLWWPGWSRGPLRDAWCWWRCTWGWRRCSGLWALLLRSSQRLRTPAGWRATSSGPPVAPPQARHTGTPTRSSRCSPSSESQLQHHRHCYNYCRALYWILVLIFFKFSIMVLVGKLVLGSQIYIRNFTSK